MAKQFHEELSEQLRIKPEQRASENITIASQSDLSQSEEGQIYDDSRQLGIQADVLRGQSRLLIEREKQRLQEDSLAQKKDVADWIARNPVNALLSMDDIDQLQKLVVVANGMRLPAPQEPIGIGQRVRSTVADVGDGVISGIGGLSNSIYGLLQFGQEYLGIDPEPGGVFDFADKALIGRELATHIRAQTAIGSSGRPEDFARAREWREEMKRARAQVYGIGLGDISQAAVSLAPTLLGGYVVQGLSKAAQLRLMGTLAGFQQAGGTFSQKRAEGADFGEAQELATLSGAITGLLTRAIPGGPETALDDLGRKLAISASPKEVFRANLVRATSVQFVSEFLEEGLDEMLQAILVDGSDWEEAIERGLKGGVIGGILGGGFGITTELQANKVQQDRNALGFADGVEALKAEVDQSTTAERSTEAVTQFMQDHGNVNHSVYLDAVVANELTKTKEGKSTLRKIGVKDSDISDAVKNEDLIEIDLARMVSSAKGSTYEVLKNNMRQSPGSKNVLEARDSQGAELELSKQDEEYLTQDGQKFEQEVSRLVNEAKEAGGVGVSRQDAEASIAPLVAHSRAMYSRQRDAYAEPADFLSKISIQRVDSKGREGREFQQDSLSSISEQITNDIDGLKLSVRESGDVVTVDKIIVPKERRDQGLGSQAMNRLIRWADANNKTLALTPSADFGGTKTRLARFYKSLGFVENKGRNKDFAISEAMLRQPVQGVASEPELGDTFESRREFFQGARGSVQVIDGRYIVNLFNNADLSTVLHETGHIFLEEMIQAISTNNVTDELARDWMTLAKWQVENKGNHLSYLKKQLKKADGDRAVDLMSAIDFIETASDIEFQDAAVKFGYDARSGAGDGLAETMHELFARGLEAYLSEGKSPSISMEKVFKRFTNWIKGVYAQARGVIADMFDAETDLTVSLNDDVRQVFDRMLATETEISQMAILNEWTNRGETEFNNIPGFDDEQAVKMNKQFKQARDEMANVVLKERSKRAAELKRSFKADLSTQPVYRAWAEIKEAGGLRLVNVREEHGQDTVNELRSKGLMAKGIDAGALPDQVARRHGYDEDTDLILDLLEAPSPDQAAQLQLESAIINDEIATPSMEAVLDSKSFKDAVNTMGKALNKALRGNLPYVEQKVISGRALSMIADMEIYEATQVNRYLTNMNRLLKENRTQLARDQFPQALESLRKSRLEMEKARHARDVRKMVAKLQSKLARIKRADPTSIDYNHWYHAVKLGERFGLLPADNRTAPADLSMADTLRQFENQGFVDPTPSIKSWLVTYDQGNVYLNDLDKRLEERRPAPKKRGPRKSYQVMEATDFEKLEEVILLLERVGRDMADPTLDTTGESVDDWLDEALPLMANVSDRGVPSVDQSSFARKIADTYNGIIDEIAAADHFYRILDNQEGFSKVRDSGRPWERVAVHGSAVATDLREEISKGTWEILEADDKVKTISEAIDRLGNNVIIDGLEPTQKAKDAGIKKWTGERLLSVVLNMGNQYNMNALASGMGWLKTETNPETGEAEVVADTAPMFRIANLFTKKELEAIQGIWDGLNTLWPRARETHIKLYGRPPAKVDGDRIELVSSEGEPVSLPGGYYPLNFDKKDITSNQKVQSDISELEYSYQGSFAPSKLELASLTARTNSNNKLVQMDPLRTIRNHIHSTSDFIAFAPWLRDMRKIFNTPGVLEVVRRKLGDSAVEQLFGSMRALAGNERHEMGHFAKFVRWAKPKASIFLLGFNVRGPLSVADAIPNIAADVGWSNYFRELNLLKNEEGLKAFNFVLENSQFMRRRLQGAWDRDAREAVESAMSSGKLTKFARFRENLTHWSMALYSYPGIAYEMPGWLAIYKREFAAHGDQKRASTAADLAIRNTQPSSDLRDQSMIQRNKGGVVSMMTMFTGWAVTRFNANRYATRMWQDKTIGFGEYAAYMFASNVLTTLPFALMGILAYGMSGEEGEEKTLEGVFGKAAEGAIVDSFRGMPLISNLVKAGFDSVVAGEPKFQSLQSAAKSPSLGLMASILSKGVTGMYDVFAEEDPSKREEAVWDIAHLMSAATGIPVSRLFEDLWQQLPE